jgi:two-component system, LuxR family, response regulator FixJ
MAPAGTVFLIDHDPAIRDLVETTLQSSGLRVRAFASAEAFAAINLCEETAGLPCCLLLELAMPGKSGLDFLEKRFGGRAPCAVVMFASRPTVQDVVKAMKLGAVDFLEKPLAPEALTIAVLDALKHRKCPDALDHERQILLHRIARLSPRERELLEAIVAGNSTKMIAMRLGISARTVDHHRANLMDKMRATNVADLVRMAVQADYKSVLSNAAPQVA